MEAVLITIALTAALAWIVRMFRKQTQKDAQCTCSGNCSHCHVKGDHNGET